VFEDHKAKKAAKEHSEAMARWEATRAAQAELVMTAQSYRGSTAAGLMLKSAEVGATSRFERGEHLWARRRGVYWHRQVVVGRLLQRPSGRPQPASSGSVGRSGDQQPSEKEHHSTEMLMFVGLGVGLVVLMIGQMLFSYSRQATSDAPR